MTRAQALQLGGRHVVDDALNDGVLRRLFPGVYALADIELTRDVMRRAALVYLPAAALSHLDALEVRGLTLAESAIHVTVPQSHRAVSAPGLAVHRRAGFRCEPPAAVVRNGLRVVRLERALVESWPLLPAVDQRSPIINALRDRRTTARRIAAALEESLRLRGAAEMRRLVELVAGGCHSELELWGHEQVFSDPRLPPSQRQYPLRVGARWMFLDRYFAAERLNVELDGAAWHGSQAQRERDLRRDAALSALGIVVVRYSHRRLCAEPAAVVDELCQILAIRRGRAVGM